MHRLLPLPLVKAFLAFSDQLRHEQLLCRHHMKVLCSPDEVLELVFAWFAAIFLRNIGSIEQEQAWCVLNLKCIAQLVIDAFGVDQAQPELATRPHESSLESAFDLVALEAVPVIMEHYNMDYLVAYLFLNKTMTGYSWLVICALKDCSDLMR